MFALGGFAEKGNAQDIKYALGKFASLSTKLGLFNSGQVLDFRVNAALHLVRAGDLDAAEVELEKIYQAQKKLKLRQPFTAQVWLELTDKSWQSFDSARQLRSARRTMEVNDRLDPEYSGIASRCAYLLKQAAAYTEAVNASNKAIAGLADSRREYSPRDRAWIYAYAACAQFAIGNAPLAERYWSKADALAPRRTSNEQQDYATMKQTVFDSRWRDLVRLRKDNLARTLAFGRDSVELRRKAFGENSSHYKQSLGSLNDFIKATQ